MDEMERWKAYKTFVAELYDALEDGEWGMIAWDDEDKGDFQEAIRTAWARTFPVANPNTREP
jgi:hypothetical protein